MPLRLPSREVFPAPRLYLFLLAPQAQLLSGPALPCRTCYLTCQTQRTALLGSYLSSHARRRTRPFWACFSTRRGIFGCWACFEMRFLCDSNSRRICWWVWGRKRAWIVEGWGGNRRQHHWWFRRRYMRRGESFSEMGVNGIAPAESILRTSKDMFSLDPKYYLCFGLPLHLWQVALYSRRRHWDNCQHKPIVPNRAIQNYGVYAWRYTYNKPTANTADIPTLCFVAICSFHIDARGSARTQKSEKMLMTPPAIKMPAKLSRHLPGTSGFQIFSLGLHMKAAQKPITR